jgi:hypothetical protein
VESTICLSLRRWGSYRECRGLLARRCILPCLDQENAVRGACGQTAGEDASGAAPAPMMMVSNEDVIFVQV